jgi:4-oxalocrotonate tautomerase
MWWPIAGERSYIGMPMNGRKAPSKNQSQQLEGNKMPLVNIQVIENVFTPAQKKEMIEKVSEVMVSIEGEELRPYTLVKIDEVKDGNWSVGGKIVTASDARRLQQTNSKAA